MFRQTKVVKVPLVEGAACEDHERKYYDITLFVLHRPCIYQCKFIGNGSKIFTYSGQSSKIYIAELLKHQTKRKKLK